MQPINQNSPRIRQSINAHIISGIALVVLLVGGLLGWAATTDIAGAVISPGSVIASSHVKQVQHPTGGVIKEIFVRNDSLVKTGDILVRLDDTVTRANLAITTKGLDQLRGRRARLQAERDHSPEIIFPAELLAHADEPRVRDQIEAERRLFEFRNTAREGQRRQLRERISQLEEEIKGLEAQRVAKHDERGLLGREVERERQLLARQLVEATRLNSLERDATQVEGQLAQLTASIAASRGKIAETELQILQIDDDLASEVADEMRDIDAKIGELEERKIAGEDQLKHIDIRSPQDGYVHELAVYTIGGVVAPGDVMMQIVPSDELFSVEARLNPQDIDQLHLGQAARLRFSAFSQRTTPEIGGYVEQISPDVSTDRRTGAPYYSARISIDNGDLPRLGDQPLVPGMPVEIFVQTGERSVASYFVKPFHDMIMRAFRES